MSRSVALGVFVVTTSILASQAFAQQPPPGFACGGSPPQKVTIQPVPKFGPIDFTNPGADCAMWQNFFYLNWPALPNQRGVPNTKARFGGPGATVWETYRTLETVFLPGARKPSPWDQPFLNAALSHDVAAQVASGQVRLLTREAKISRLIVDHIAQTKSANDTFLRDIKQADGNTLYDQNKRPVYYEIAMNRVQFDYIVNNGLYNADTQATYVSKTNIVLPTGSFELKAAWKILTAAEIKSGRFHMTRAYISGPLLLPVTVGLVGLHVFTGGGDNTVGLWGTFAQIDNAPLDKAPATGTYSFNNPACTTCPVNSTTTNPTQVVQIFPDDPAAAKINQQAQGIIKQYDPNTAWQYYKLIDVQWSPQTVTLKTPVPIMLPMPMGAPSVDTLMNPVLETFMQQKGTSCVGCHAAFASTASNANIGSGYSFMFGYAQTPTQP